jgi:hypothetical protein
MAAWQFDLFLIPHGKPMPQASEDGLDIPGVPSKSALGAQASLLDCLGSPWLMMENWIVFGIENGTRVDFQFDEAGAVDVKVRLDVRANNAAVIDAICTLAAGLDSRFFDAQERQFIEPRQEVIQQAATSSKASKFARNPRHFIVNLPAV